MALYRLHKAKWEQELRPATEAYRSKMGLTHPKDKGKSKDSDEQPTSGKRKREDEDENEWEDTDGQGREKQRFPGGGRKGISSGLAVVVKRNGKRLEPRQRGVPRSSDPGGPKWWEEV
jgi:RNA exonuclease 4